MNQFLEDIRAFHRKFGFLDRKQAGFIEPEHMQMRLNFLLEELLELARSCGFDWDVTSGGHQHAPILVMREANEMKHNLKDALDALVDLQYVLLGTAYLMGLFNKKGVVVTVQETPDELPKPRRVKVHIFEEAWRRIQAANMRKQRSLRGDKAERGGQYDVVKPAGWRPPELNDLL